jgi:hypothetical protein
MQEPAMTQSPRKPETDVVDDSYRKETNSKEKHDKAVKERNEGHRSMMNAPVDPNSPTTKMNIPPGIEPQDAADPGRATPGAPPVDNRSGRKP